ncbi:cytochrome P450 family protein [Nonomuraea endophytica]|uniref:Cytochrome P450 n=1 Tax=Nonomuraea endophytica TaxID=714136 RepID=A0A7W8ACG4_9ACTN|nr:cytochrome P450 [Nonomuraea endophytica]MBB5083699.1 cytochrome P450 [Nonomuraea endophytica]
MDTSTRHTIDPACRDWHAHGDRLRQAGPLVAVEVEGVRAWAAARFATLQAVLAHPDLSRDIRHWDPQARAGLCPRTSVAKLVLDTSVLNAEGQAHRRLRGPLVKAFSARRIGRLRPSIEAITAGLIDRLARRPPGPVDVRREFAYPLPSEVISQLMGIPPELRPRLHELNRVLARVGAGPQDTGAARTALRRMLAEVIALRHREPGDDLISALMAIHVDDGVAFTAIELADTVELLFIAGHVTTVSLITNAVRALLAAPEQLALVTSGTLPWSAVVEEALRWDSPLAHFPMRYAVRDVEIDGVTVRRGEAVLASFAAAGRDPEHYGERAGHFVLSGSAPGHLSFGHGPHFCLGATLGRLEAEVALSALFTAFPQLAAAVPPGEVQPVGSIVGNSARTFPVLLGPRAR